MRQSIEVDINASPDRVWAVMSDLNWQEWTPSVKSIKRLDDGEFRVGSRVKISQPGFPPALWKATAIEPGQGFTWVSVAPLMRVVANHSIYPAPSGAKAMLSIEFQGWLGPWFGKLTSKTNQKYLEHEAKGLKARSENPSYHHDGKL